MKNIRYKIISYLDKYTEYEINKIPFITKNFILYRNVPRTTPQNQYTITDQTKIILYTIIYTIIKIYIKISEPIETLNTKINTKLTITKPPEDTTK